MALYEAAMLQAHLAGKKTINTYIALVPERIGGAGA